MPPVCNVNLTRLGKVVTKLLLKIGSILRLKKILFIIFLKKCLDVYLLLCLFCIGSHANDWRSPYLPKLKSSKFTKVRP